MQMKFFDTVREIDLNGVIREIGMESHVLTLDRDDRTGGPRQCWDCCFVCWV